MILADVDIQCVISFDCAIFCSLVPIIALTFEEFVKMVCCFCEGWEIKNT